MDRPVICLKHLADGSVLVAVEHPDGTTGPVRVDRGILVDELAFPRHTEVGRWIRIPVRPALTGEV